MLNISNKTSKVKQLCKAVQANRFLTSFPEGIQRN